MTESPKAKMSSLTSYVWFPVSLCDSWVARLLPGTAFVVIVNQGWWIFIQSRSSVFTNLLYWATRAWALIWKYCSSRRLNYGDVSIIADVETSTSKYSGASMIIQQHQQTVKFRLSAPGWGPYLCRLWRVHNIYGEAIIKQPPGLQLL